MCSSDLDVNGTAKATTVQSTNLSDGTNSTSTTNAIKGSAKAWVNFQGGYGNTGGTVLTSYNVSSVTVLGTGQYQVNFSNALSSSNYALAGGGQRQASVGGNEASPNISFSNFSTSSFYIGCQDNNSDGYQTATVLFAIAFI